MRRAPESRDRIPPRGTMGPPRAKGSVAELDVPVGEVDEVPPAFMELAVEGDVDEGAPLRPLGLADEAHAGFVRQAVAFARIARDAGADDIFPAGEAALIPRDDVVEVQVP